MVSCGPWAGLALPGAMQDAPAVGGWTFDLRWGTGKERVTGREEPLVWLTVRREGLQMYLAVGSQRPQWPTWHCPGDTCPHRASQSDRQGLQHMCPQQLSHFRWPERGSVGKAWLAESCTLKTSAVRPGCQETREALSQSTF